MDHNVIYMSSAVTKFSQTESAALMEQSRKFNSDWGITGLLLYAHGNFMQLQEGSKQEIEGLMERIKKGARHQRVKVLEKGEIAMRQFLRWSMAFVDFVSPEVRALPGFGTYLDGLVDIDDRPLGGSRSGDMLAYFKAVMTAARQDILFMAKQVEGRDCATFAGNSSSAK